MRWGDKHGGYGEHYWDFNHAGHDHDDGHHDESQKQEQYVQVRLQKLVYPLLKYLFHRYSAIRIASYTDFEEITPLMGVTK